MYLIVVHRCWGLCFFYFTFSALSGPAAIEPPEEFGVFFYTSLWRQNDFPFQMDRAVNCFSKLCSKEPKPLIMKNLGSPIVEILVLLIQVVWDFFNLLYFETGPSEGKLCVVYRGCRQLQTQ